MGAESAVLLPVRLETRFNVPGDGSPTRLRVLVVPDGCWFDRHQPASADELALLKPLLDAAGGKLVSGKELAPKVSAAFDELARKVGPGRALWLARTDPSKLEADQRKGARGTRVHGLPPKLHLYVDIRERNRDGRVSERRVHLGTRTVAQRSFTFNPDEDHADGWWPSWAQLKKAGLTFEVNLVDEERRAINPKAITALYVVGVGDGAAEQVLRPHLDSGFLGLLQAGTPTNTVAGSAAADLGRDVVAWRTLLERPAVAEEEQVGLALCADAKALGPLVGSSDGLANECATLVISALWPALASVLLSDVWFAPPPGLSWPEEHERRARISRSSHSLREWATTYLRPDGPLPLLRLGNQPYGLWPVSDWDNWRETESDEGHFGLAQRLVSPLADRAGSGLGSVVGADAERLWELISQTPTSSAYEARGAVHIKTIQGLLAPDAADGLERWWLHTLGALSEALGDAPLEGTIGEHVMTFGAPAPLLMNVVLPDIVFDAQGEPLFLPALDVHPDEALSFLRGAPGLWVSSACRHFLELFEPTTLNRDLWIRMTKPSPAWWPPSLLWRLLLVSGLIALDQACRESNQDYQPQLSLAHRVMLTPIGPDADAAVEAYERFRGTLHHLADLCERSDQQRLPAVLERTVCGVLDSATYRVDPWLTGSAYRRLQQLEGPRAIGLYGWVDQPHTGTPGPDYKSGFLLAPSDAQIRTAVVLRDKSQSDPDSRWQLNLTSAAVRDAARLADDIRAGAHPAEALGREVERLIDDRRKIDNLRKNFPLRTEHAGRRTCDGLKVLAAAQARPADKRLADLTPKERKRVLGIAATIDTYADLLVADGVHHALAGRPEAARQSMEAASGLGMPPTLDVLATPRRGRSLHTTVLAHLPAAAVAANERSPVAIASPALAAWLVAETGRADAQPWTWVVAPERGKVKRVQLKDLGFVPADALAIHPKLLDRIALARAGVNGAIRRSPDRPATARTLAATLSARAPVGGDFGLDPDDAALVDGMVRHELAARLDKLRKAAKRLITQIGAATSDAQKAAALREAARWGFVPDFDGPVDRELTAAADELGARLDHATQLGPATDIGVLARALGDLAAPEAAIPLFITVRRPQLAAWAGSLTAEPADAHGRPRLDTTWLELVAAVRPPLARIEAHQALAAIKGRHALSATTSHPSDPWLMRVPAPKPAEADPRLVVSYGPKPLPRSGAVAIGLLDSWAEVIPRRKQTASSAFRFNAPGSRAPQALLLAVTPAPGEDLTAERVVAIVGSARRTAHARMARREDLANVDLLGGGLLPAFEEGGFQRATEATWRDWPI